MSRTVLIATDGSENSQRAFEFYLNGIRRDNDKLLLLYVQRTPNLPSFSVTQPLSLPTEEWTKAIQKEIEKSTKIIQECEVTCEMNKIPKQSFVGSGDPGEAIVQISQKNDANLIIVGSRGLNKVRRTFVGSVSDYVIHHSNIPVLVVPPEEC